jgi:hypothetical protein
VTEFLNAGLPVDTATLLRVLTWMETAGIRFVIDQSPSGSYWLTPATVLDYLRDPKAFLTTAGDVSVADYQGWKASEGVIQCHARTRGGRGPRCRNLIARDGDYLTPQQWADLNNSKVTG